MRRSVVLVGVAGEYERPRLTRRERELLAEILAGRNNKAIALKFRVKEQTVRNQLAVLFHKVGVSSRLELAVKFAKRTADPT